MPMRQRAAMQPVALMSTRNVAEGTRAQLAAQLAAYYSELAAFDPPSPPFSLARVLLAHAERSELKGREREVCEAAAIVLGQDFNPMRTWIPLNAVAVRALATTPGAKGGYLVGVDTVDTADVLRPWSVVASAGAMLLTGLTDGVVIPRITTAVTAGWLAAENQAGPSETPPTLGNVSITPKTAIAFVKFSMQLLRQGAAFEPFLRVQLLRAVGELLDVAFFSGAGGAQPLGLLQTAGIGTQSGTSLAHAGLLAMRQKVLTAGGREANLIWVGPPAMQETLGARVRETGATGSGRFLWDDSGILGKPAFATKNAPATTLVVGDFGQSVVGIFGPGIRVDVDPSQDFASGGLVARVLLMSDVAFPQPGSFTAATSIT
jgi:HK97 family phage major capsid protein